MAVAVQSVSTNQGNVTTLTITKPSGTGSGDLLIIHVWAEVAGGTIASWPSGFTEIAQGQNSSGGSSCGMAWKIAGGSEPADYTIDVPNGNAGGIILRISGHDPTTPINTYSQRVNNTADTTAVVDAVTPSVANCLLLISIGWGTNINTGTPSITNNNPGTWDERYDIIQGNRSGSLYSALYAPTTTTGAGAMPRAVSGGGKNVTHLVAIAPPSSTAYSTTLTDAVALVDTVLKTDGRTLSEAVVLVDTVLKQGAKVLSDAVVLVDSIIKIPGKVLSDVVTLVDTVVRNTTMRVLSEAVVLVDTVTTLRVQAEELLESISLNDIFTRFAYIVKSEVITLVDTITNVLSGFRTFVENITLVDTVLKLPSKVMAEAVELTDTVIRGSTKVLSEAVALVDTVVKHSSRVLTDAVTLVDTFTRQVSKIVVYVESITLVTTLIRQITNFVSRAPFVRGKRSDTGSIKGVDSEALYLVGKKEEDGGMTGTRF